MTETEKARLLNILVRRKIEDKDTNNYLYASLSQPPIKILDKRGSDNELDFIVECPNCHSAVCYGTDTFMFHGYIYCSNEGCKEEVEKNYKEKHIKGDDE